MRTCLKLCVLTLACLMVFGCAAKKGERQEDDSLWAEQGESVPYSESDAERRFRRSFEMAMDEADDEGDFATAGGRKGLAPLRANRPEINNRLLRRARSAIGTPYVSGGMAPGGFDCSGLVCWAYKSVGVKLPRTAREQSVVGRRITNVADMQAGDIVAFRHPRRGYHTGIYVGGGNFIHSPHRRARVRINSLDDPYFKGTFLGARRINMDGSENLVAQAESRLNDFAEEKVVRELSRKHGKSDSSAAARDRKGGKRDKAGRDKKRGRAVEVASNDRHSSRGDARRDRAHRKDRTRDGYNDRKAASRDRKDRASRSSASQRAGKPQSDKKKRDVASRDGGKSKKSGSSSRKRKNKS
ncbi:MAG: NlpC/P60 family protein [Desulfovibrio desulfuricans]|jgi:hypothetical protein|nr:NlpC/P60 family protein [Desulfovibrio desulfuricans]